MRAAAKSGRGSSRRPGLLLLEAVLLAAVFALAAGFLFPVLSAWYEERRLDLTAAEVSSIIRSVQAEARSGESSSTSTLEYKDLVFTMNGGRVRYYSLRGIRQTQPIGWLSEGITMSPVTVQLRFMKNSFAGNSDNYSFRLYGPSRTSARQVTVAMYTGRVRVESVQL